MRPTSSTFPVRPFLFVVALALSACDVPSTGPDFSFTTSLKTPVIFNKTFVFMGPDDGGLEALVDTTNDTFDNLFSESPTDRTLFVVQNLDDFEIGALDDVLPSVDVAPVDVQVSIGDLADQSFSSAFDMRLETFTLDPSNPSIPAEVFQEIPVLPDPSGGETRLTVPNFLVPPQVNLVSLSGVSLESVQFTEDTSDANAFSLTLTNNLPADRLTAASNAGSPPSVSLVQGGVTVGTVPFGFVDPGQSRTVRISIAGRTLSTEDFEYVFDLGTANGVGPFYQNPGAVTLRTDLEPLHYGETSVTTIPPQSDIDVSQENLTLNGEDLDFSGMVTLGGEANITVTNTLPIPVVLDVMEVKNLTDIEGYPAGSTVLYTSGQQIPADGSVTIPVQLGQVGIAPQVSVTARASSPGTTAPVTLRADQGLSFSLNSSVSIDRLYFKPGAQEFSSTGTFDLNVEDVRFNTDADYVTLRSGTLRISDLYNEMDLGLSDATVSLPGFRVAPYGVGDTLVIHFTGSLDNPTAYTYRKIDAGSGPRSVDVDLSGVRVYPRDNRLTYHIQARSEAATTTRTLRASDQIRASIEVLQADVSSVSADLDPRSIAVTDDADGDRFLDVFDDREAEITALDDLKDLASEDIDGLQLSGSEFSFNVRTNLSADIELYAALVGTTSDGEQVYLSGRGDFAVAAGDSMAAAFRAAGAPIPTDRLIRFTVEGAPSPGETVTRTIVLNGANSNVDDFISTLPESIRYVGKALVQPGGGHVALQEPFDLSATIGASIPLSIAGDFTFRKEVDADLKDLQDLTDPGKDLIIEGANLRLTYENGLPLGLDARLEVLDAADAVTVVFPQEGAAPLALDPAATDANGIATEVRSGMVDFSVNEEELRLLSRGKRIRLVLTLDKEEGSAPSRLRADDQIQLRLLGDFQFQVNVGN